VRNDEILIGRFEVMMAPKKLSLFSPFSRAAK